MAFVVPTALAPRKSYGVNSLTVIKKGKPAVGITNRAETSFSKAYQALALPHCLSRVIGYDGDLGVISNPAE